MRAAPAIQVSLTRFGVWRAAVLLLTAVATLAVLGWFVGREAPAGTGALVVAGAAAVLSVWFGVSVAKVQPAELCWDGQCWALRALRPASSESTVGEVSVVVDLGIWMMLHFVPATSPRRARALWLPVQRRGIESQWHALRCAVYSPRPTPLADASRAGNAGLG